jgi:glycine oxidase
MPTNRNGADVIVVGGGAIGLAIAREVRIRGRTVLVLESGRAGSGASRAAAGMLSPLGEALDPGPFLSFGLESLALWPSLARDLEEESGVVVELRRSGKLRVALTEPERVRLQRRLEWAREQGVSARWMQPAEVTRAANGMGPSALGGLLLEDDYRVDNRALTEALLVSSRARGVEVREMQRVQGVQIAAGRCTGVYLEDGTALEAECVVLAAGAWSGQIQGLPVAVPVRPVRGEMVALRPVEPPPSLILESEAVYLVPRDDGRLLAGATEEEVGFEPGPSAGGIRSVLDAALGLMPSLVQARITETWSGFRPGSPDGMPILGAYPEVDDLFLATGHYRNGILLTPATARSLADLIDGVEPGLLPPEFTPERVFTSAVDSVPA